MRERLANALRGFGPVTDEERDRQNEAEDRVVRLPLKRRRPGFGTVYLLDPGRKRETWRK